MEGTPTGLLLDFYCPFTADQREASIPKDEWRLLYGQALLVLCALPLTSRILKIRQFFKIRRLQNEL